MELEKLESSIVNGGKTSSRRKFLGTAITAASLSGLAMPFMSGAFAKSRSMYPAMKVADVNKADAWFKNVKGTHRIVYDASEPHMGLPFIWSWAYYLTNNQTGTSDDDMTAVVVLRHNAIPFAMGDKLWKKYKFGETFNITDNTTGALALRNPFYLPKEGDYPFPGIDGIKVLQDRGVMFCVCNLALSVYSGMTAKKMSLNAEEVRQEWVDGVLPGIQIVPSGVWALGRAQEQQCGYIYAGG